MMDDDAGEKMVLVGHFPQIVADVGDVGLICVKPLGEHLSLVRLWIF
jgi:hypothetical protein